MNKRQKFHYLLGSKWTAKHNTWGWRHFQVINRSKQGPWVFAEMVASCDPKVRFWLNAQQLTEQSDWLSGWRSLEEIREKEQDI